MVGKILLANRDQLVERTTLFLFFLCGAFFTISASGVSGKLHSLPDSLLTKDCIYEYTFTDFEKAKLIISQMRLLNLASQYTLDIAEGDLLFNNGKYNEAIIYYEQVLKSDSVKNSKAEYMEILHRMISYYDCLHNEKMKIDYVKKLLQAARIDGNKAMESIALFNMGKMIYYQGDKQRGYKIVEESIALMGKTDYKYKNDNLRYNYYTLLIMQQQDKKYEDALKTVGRLEKVLMENTDSEPKIDGLIEKEMKGIYAQRAVLLSFLGRMAEADAAYYSWKKVCRVYTKDDYLIVPYLMNKKMYNDAIRIYTSREVFLKQQADTINYQMRTIKRMLGRAYEELGEYRKAAIYFEELAVLNDSLNIREQQNSAMELAAIYDTHKKEVEREKLLANTKVSNVLLSALGGIFLLLLILVLRNAQYMKTVRLKNAVMVNTIQQLLANKRELYNIKTTDNLPEEATDDDEGYQLFRKLDHMVVSRKLYLNPDISREELMKLIHVDKNRFGKIIQQYARTNTTGYINDKRLEYAVELLEEFPDYTINSIAQLCGIPNIPTFNRLFREKFGMTPTELKKQI